MSTDDEEHEDWVRATRAGAVRRCATCTCAGGAVAEDLDRILAAIQRVQPARPPSIRQIHDRLVERHPQSGLGYDSVLRHIRRCRGDVWRQIAP